MNPITPFRSEQELHKIKTDLKFLLLSGQENQTIKEFHKKSPKYLKIGLLVFIPWILFFALGVYLLYFHFPNVGIDFKKNANEVFLEGFKIWLGALATYIITVVLTNRWQQRSLSFEMIKELNSIEFHRIRCMLVNKMEKSVANGDELEAMDGWLPYYDNAIPRRIYHEEPGTVTPEEFYEKHALASMVYFILRIANYYKFDMLNKHLTRHLFHFFFCHYEIPMLEFSAALKRYIGKQVEAGFEYDTRWELTCDDISLFFRIVGLSGKLADNHTFIYFPSLNEQILENQVAPINPS